MHSDRPIPLSALPYPVGWEDAAQYRRVEAARAAAGRRIVVLDDDPTGIQTVHGVPVYTNWEAETLLEAFSGADPMFFVLTNSRGMTAAETEQEHRRIARRLVRASAQTRQDYILISRSDSTLRGHYPLETVVLREEIEAASEKRFDGEIIYPFFEEGGRLTLESVHYVREDDQLIPCGQTEYARDKSFGYRASYLPDYCEEKTGGRVSASSVIRITLEDLRQGGTPVVLEKLMQASQFSKIVVDSICYGDVIAFAEAYWEAVARGKEFLFRSAAAVPRVLGGIAARPLLKKEELVAQDNANGGIVLIGSHVQKTTRQLALVRESGLPACFLEFNQHRVLEAGGLEDEVERTVALAAERICRGETVVIYTRRDRLDLPNAGADRQLEISVRISDAVTSIIGKLPVRPRFILAKGGITSSDVGVKALQVRKAMAAGQVRPGIPVWITGPESRFPGMPYIIFPGNVGADEDLLRILEELISQ